MVGGDDPGFMGLKGGRQVQRELPQKVVENLAGGGGGNKTEQRSMRVRRWWS